MTHTPEEIERLFVKWVALALPGRYYRCFLCGKMTGKANTTGYLPGLGPVMKCPACRGEYVEIVRSLREAEHFGCTDENSLPPASPIVSSACCHICDK